MFWLTLEKLVCRLQHALLYVWHLFKHADRMFKQFKSLKKNAPVVQETHAGAKLNVLVPFLELILSPIFIPNIYSASLTKHNIWHGL